jgi:hypothetical protein
MTKDHCCFDAEDAPDNRPAGLGAASDSKHSEVRTNTGIQ